MKNNIGRMKCPVCGHDTWVRENKNGILYTYCSFLHHSKLNGEDSLMAKEALKQGKKWTNGMVFIYPKEREEKENGQSIARTDFDGRNDGERSNAGNDRNSESDTEYTAGTYGIGCF